MNMVIFTPISQASAIGRMACLVTKSLLKQGHDVIIISTEQELLKNRATHEFGVVCLAYGDKNQVISALKKSDIVVYQIGNNFQYHCGALEWIDKWPGIICLHDFFLGGLFSHWALDNKADADDILSKWYGLDIPKDYWNYTDMGTYLEQNAPMTEWICSLGYGVITHGSWGIQRVLDSCPGPVEVVALPVSVPCPSPNSVIGKVKDKEVFNLVTIGTVNSNKRIRSVLQAIGASDVLRTRLTYRLAGQVDSAVEADLSKFAKNLGVQFIVMGEVDDALLYGLIKDADVMVCLRYPCIEAASASTIEAMLFGKPTIVMDIGFYKELPDTCVRKIAIETEVSDLTNELEYLLNNEDERILLGKNATKWAKSVFCPENYARKLVAFSERTFKSIPIIDMGMYFQGILHQWNREAGFKLCEDTISSLEIFES